MDVFMKKLVLASLLTLSSSLSALEIGAPFGFNWGQSKEELVSAGVEFSTCLEKSGIESCQTSTPLKDVSFGDVYILRFDSEQGLQQVVMIGNSIESDVLGSKGKSIYSDVKSSLVKKYGEPESYEYVGEKLYDGYDEFYQCLKYDGCGVWASFWSPENGGHIQMRLIGLLRGVGHLKLTYESKDWEKLLELSNERELAADSDAL